jgi:hypothetical protein
VVTAGQPDTAAKEKISAAAFAQTGADLFVS